MTSRKSIATGLGAAVAAALLGTAAIPATASAQSYYDPCARDTAQRGVTGAAVGGIGGAVIGSQLSARGRHTENSLIGGVVGALAGAVVGRSTSGCTPGYANGYYDNRGGYDGGYDNRGYYDNRDYSGPAAYGPGYVGDRGYYESRYGDDRGYYDRGYYGPPQSSVNVYIGPARPVYVAPRYWGGGRGWYGY